MGYRIECRCVIDGQRIGFAGRQRDYFAALFNARGRPLRPGELRDLIYGGEPWGGPSDEGVKVQVHLLRKRLALTQFRITGMGYGRGWALRRVPASTLPYRPDPKYQGRPRGSGSHQL